MSLKLGKRSLFDDDPDYFQVPLFHQYKRPFGAIGPAEPIANQQNVEFIKKFFPNVDESVVLSTLDECENNLELAVEILRKNEGKSKLSLGSNSLLAGGKGLFATQESTRTIKRIVAPGVGGQPKESKPFPAPESSMKMAVEENSTQVISASQGLQNTTQANNRATDLNLMEVAKYLVDNLTNSQSYEDATNITAKTLTDLLEKVRKDDETKITKYSEENTILKRAFMKQYDKAKKNQYENEELKTKVTHLDNEAKHLRGVNFKLLLRLMSAEPSSSEEELKNMHIY